MLEKKETVVISGKVGIGGCYANNTDDYTVVGETKIDSILGDYIGKEVKITIEIKDND